MTSLEEARVESVAQASPNILEERLAALGELFPGVVSEGRIDVAGLRALLGDTVDDRPERYTFTWSGMRGAEAALQQPSRATLAPDRDGSVDFDTTRNAFIEGDNLEVLKVLAKPYANRVKMIYIDPPYNTGKTFVYPDDYADPLASYLALTGQQDEDGNRLTSNPETSGRYHSSWLSMMYPRLYLARKLLHEDGAIFVSIDDHEVHNLRMLMNEVFGEENFVDTIIWEKKYSPQNDARWLSANHDYVLLYARNKATWRPHLLPRTEEANARFVNPDNDPRGPWKSSDLSVRTYSAASDYEITTPSGRVVSPPEGRCWVVSERRFEELKGDKRIWFGPNGDSVPSVKKFLSEVKQGMTSLTIWEREEVGDTQDARREIRALFGDTGVFDTPKSIGLIERMMQLCTTKDGGDIVLDFFAGSASTAHAALHLNREDGGDRRFIMVQLPEPLKKPKELDDGRRLTTVADVGAERVRRVIASLRAADAGQERARSEDLGVRMFALAPSNFKPWTDVTPDDAEVYADQMAMFADPLTGTWTPESVLYEVALREGYGLSVGVSRVGNMAERILYRVVDPDRGQSFYACLDAAPITLETIRSLNLGKDDLFVCRDIALDDAAAANLALQCRLKTL